MLAYVLSYVFMYPAWPVVDGAALMSKGGAKPRHSADLRAHRAMLCLVSCPHPTPPFYWDAMWVLLLVAVPRDIQRLLCNIPAAAVAVVCRRLTL